MCKEIETERDTERGREREREKERGRWLVGQRRSDKLRHRQAIKKHRKEL